MTSDIFFPRILHGGDYNPEQWPEEVWDDDVRLMRLAHVNVATLPVFGWVSLQPDEETFTFEWLDRVIEKLTCGGVGLCLATATASVPAWMDQKYPDILRVDANGVRQRHGNRHTFCPNSPNFRRLSTNLARRMAERYGAHPGLLVWHVSNEYGNPCYCDQCGAAFRLWLANRYGSLEETNRRWNTTFWGHTYTDWSQIEPPTKNGEGSMQSLLIDYDRFQSESLLNCFKAERDVLKSITPQIPVTTNLMGPFKPLDYHRWGREMDLVSWDSYPQRGATPAEIAFNHSLMRGCKEGRPWMLMEQTPSQQNWQAYNALKRPGVMRLWSYQAMAHGANAIMYFQWRRSRGACEKFHGAVVEHAGRSDARVFQEVAALGAELEALGGNTLGARVVAPAAVLFDWDNWWAVEYSSGPSVDLKYHAQAQSYYSALHDLGIVADVASPDADLSKYKLIIAPVLYMVKPGVAERLEAYVRAGGVLVTTYFSGIVDETDLVHPGGYPGPLRRLLGIWAEEIDVLSPSEANSVRFESDGAISDCGMLCDLIHTEGAEVLARYERDFYAGMPAVTVNGFGEGKAYYLATALAAGGLRSFLQIVLDEAQIQPPLGARPPHGVEVTEQSLPSGEALVYVLNHNSVPAPVALPAGVFRELITGEEVEGMLELGAYGVGVLSEV
ncbi:MAG: Beta-galactosidase [Capsulimonas sp.]|jgi:beta-galactosidase|nr:Beta-galactosidase [Capsulimonas sp.]